MDSVLLHVLVNKIPLVHHSYVFDWYKYELKSFASERQAAPTSLVKSFWRGTQMRLFWVTAL